VRVVPSNSNLPFSAKFHIPKQRDRPLSNLIWGVFWWENLEHFQAYSHLRTLACEILWALNWGPISNLEWLDGMFKSRELVSHQVKKSLLDKEDGLIRTTRIWYQQKSRPFILLWFITIIVVVSKNGSVISPAHSIMKHWSLKSSF